MNKKLAIGLSSLLVVAIVATLVVVPMPLDVYGRYVSYRVVGLFQPKNDPYGVAESYLDAIVKGDGQRAARYVVSEGRESAIERAQENAAFRESLKIRTWLISMKPEKVALLSPDEIVFLAEVELFVGSRHLQEQEHFIWGVTMLRVDDEWKITSAEVIELL